ncbi:hypothetical protein ABZ619_23785 [Streptomyces sp. NPDC007851]|uniref:hypothetical protein n=1 Tax=Streptomyces sp. NPDC007851 TaxID=3155008 RepID=UPI0033FB3299
MLCGRPAQAGGVLTAAFAFLPLLACGVGGYALFGFSLPGAVCMTVTTLTTEGFSAQRCAPPSCTCPSCAP